MLSLTSFGNNSHKNLVHPGTGGQVVQIQTILPVFVNHFNVRKPQHKSCSSETSRTLMFKTFTIYWSAWVPSVYILNLSWSVSNKQSEQLDVLESRGAFNHHERINAHSIHLGTEGPNLWLNGMQTYCPKTFLIVSLLDFWVPAQPKYPKILMACFIAAELEDAGVLNDCASSSHSLRMWGKYYPKPPRDDVGRKIQCMTSVFFHLQLVEG